MDVEKLKRSNLRWLKAEKLNHYLVFEFISKIMASWVTCLISRIGYLVKLYILLSTVYILLPKTIFPFCLSKNFELVTIACPEIPIILINYSFFHPLKKNPGFLFLFLLFLAFDSKMWFFFLNNNLCPKKDKQNYLFWGIIITISTKFPCCGVIIGMWKYFMMISFFKWGYIHIFSCGIICTVSAFCIIYMWG